MKLRNKRKVFKISQDDKKPGIVNFSHWKSNRSKGRSLIWLAILLIIVLVIMNYLGRWIPE